MNRMRFGRWGAELDRGGFARALAAAGVLTAAGPPGPGSGWLRGEVADAAAAPGMLRERVGAGAARQVPLRWHNPLLDPAWDELAQTLPADRLAAAWPGEPVRFALDAGDFAEDLLTPTWVVQALTRPDVAGRSAVLRLPVRARSGRVPRWRWPLEVGFLADRASEVLHRQVHAGRRAAPALAALTAPHSVVATAHCDLLLVPAPLRQALPALLRTQVSSAVVVFTGGLTGRWRHVEPLVEALRSVTEASVVGFAGTDEPVSWLAELTQALFEGAALDEAFTAAGARAGAVDALLIAEPAAIAGFGPAASTGPPPAALGSEVPAPAEAVAALGGPDAPGKPGEPRWLQARVLAGDVGPVHPVETFAPGALHAVDVRIARDAGGWEALAAPFPDRSLPAGENAHHLTVVLTEPDLLDEPLTGELVLPARGASAATTFLLRTRTDTAAVDARLIVAYGNRILQTARLRGGVAGRVPDPTIRLETETVVRLHTADLADRRRFDAALVLEAGGDGPTRATALVDARAAVVDLDDSDLAKTVDRIRARFEEIVEAPEDFSSLEAEGTRDLLLFLATRGVLLRDALVTDFVCASLADAERLQLVGARPEAFLPIEFCYDLPAPDPDAHVCPAATAALGAGVDCPGPHDVTVVCPSGFWGLSKVIERHLHQPAEAGRPERGHLLRSEPTAGRDRIDLDGPLLLAASARVDGFAERTRARLAAQLDAVTGGRARAVDSWTQWLDSVDADNPSVLLLLPHTAYEETLEVYGLEIGAADRLWGSQLTGMHLHGTQDNPVLVAVLGCATADGPVTYEDFPARFRHCGAEIFIGTLPRILGRHAAPMGALLVELLAQPSAAASLGERSFGDLMRELRRRCLLRGEPVALSLVAYGDADWVLAPTGE